MIENIVLTSFYDIMSMIILFCVIVIFSCIITNKFSSKLGMPSLAFFMFLGVLLGSDGILKLSFDDYDLTSKLCSVGLLFIIFYGAFVQNVNT